MIYYIGDVHGQREKLEHLLREANLVDENLQWSGGTDTLCLLGDYTDRGPDGIGVIELVMRLQQEAVLAGGTVHALIGNHDIVILGAHRFGDTPTTGPGGTFLADWLQCGGNPEDLSRLQPHHIEWLTQLPAMLLVGETLLTHADATFYTRYGATIETVQDAFRTLLANNDPYAWDHLLEDFSERLHFVGEDNAEVVTTFLSTFGATKLIHGHTPIPYLLKQDATTVTSAFIYADGRCVNVDGGMYMGGSGFVYQCSDDSVYSV